MEYLISKNTKYVAHIWDDGDTYCRMFFTGGLSKKKYFVSKDKEDRKICHMCKFFYYDYSGIKI